MIEEKRNEDMIASIRGFSAAWGYDFNQLGTSQQLMMIRNYYLDLICANMAKRTKPTLYLDPSKLVRG